MYNILIATGYPILEMGLSQIVQKAIPDGVVLNTATSFSIMRDTLAKTDVQMVVLDLQLLKTGTPARIDVTILEKFVAGHPSLKIVVLYEQIQLPLFRWMYMKGIMGILGKGAGVDAVEKCIRSVYGSEIYISNDLLVGFLNTPPPLNGAPPLTKDGWDRFTGVHLTEREDSIAGLLAEGKTSFQICTLLSLHPSTVATHKKRIFNKLHVRNVIELERLIRPTV